jgi:hypothetical protein
MLAELANRAGRRLMTRGSGSDKLRGFRSFLMAFIICDDHNLDVEADGVDNAAAKQLMLTDSKPNPTPIETEIIEFGKIHRHCNIRILAG